VIRTIGVVSAKGGVGKTVTTLNLSAALMKMGRSVIAVDADVKMSGLALQLGMYHFPLTLNDILNQNIPILEALYIHSTGLRIIPASLYLKDVNISRLKNVLSHPGLDNNIVLIDTPPGLEKSNMTIMKACQEILVVTTPELPSVADVMKTIKVAKESNIKVLGIVVNRFRKTKEQLTPEEISFACKTPVVGTVPEDKKLHKSVFSFTPSVFMNPCSPASIEFSRIASWLVDEDYKKPSLANRLLWKLKR
jgi:septum site-determining protein MinD